MQVIIVGCGKVGSSLASILIDQGHDVVVVESNTQLISEASDLDCIKITGVPIDRDVLRQAGIETTDVLCAVTQNDNINIMVAQIAGIIFNVPRIITRIFNPKSRAVFEEFGLDAVCSTELTVQEFLRRIEGKKESTMRTVFGSDVVFTNVPVEPDIVGEEITHLTSETGKLIFGLLRRGKLLLAADGLRVQPDDELVLADLQ
ncbi:MAG: NAD-binding protein [Clostridia bacterium]|nr:NAD-binding protein [Clostridia bacterium]